MCMQVLADSGPPPEIMENLIPLTAITLGSIIAFTWVICATIHAVIKDRTIERTKRDVAAYVAEGSMTPAEGERLIKARAKDTPSC